MILCLLLCRDTVAILVIVPSSLKLCDVHTFFFFLAVLCIPGFYMFLIVSFSFLLSVSAWLDYFLELSCQLPGLKTEVERIFFLLVCVKYSLHSSQATWTECISTVNSSVALVWLKLLNICSYFVKTLNILSFILAVCLHVEN